MPITVRQPFSHSSSTFIACLLGMMIWFCAAGCGPKTKETEKSAAAPATTTAAAAEGGQGQAGRPTNRLSRETSPYLLMHAHNPVDWYPWGPEALEKARAEGKLIFVSVGYSTCHWCHLMERLVFSNPEIARYMNENFVNIKVDREERPDLDEVFMTALTLYFQASGSSQTGGWPLSLVLTPDGKPLFGGTYMGPVDEDGRLGLPNWLRRVADAWTRKHRDSEKNAAILARAVQAASQPSAPPRDFVMSASLVEPIVDRLKNTFDPEDGGFGFEPNDPERPKFPVPTKLALLQYEATHHQNEVAAQMLKLTLDHMADGGIYDQLAGGFHRYSIDRHWKVPHFEKMLYDNAQLAEVYAAAFHHTGDVRYREIAEGTLSFVLRELADPNGAFYSALDADTDGVEGKFYVWQKRELAAALRPEETQLVAAVFGIQGEPNSENGFVLTIDRPLDQVAVEWKLSPAQLKGHVERIKAKLLSERQKRQPPFRDDKILTGWNGLMIRSLARSGIYLKRRDYTQAAEKAATFIVQTLRDDRGRLLRNCRGKQSKGNGTLDDYAYLVEGLLALHEATNDDKWLNAASRLTDQQLEWFWDDRQGACFFTAHDHEQLLARTKTAYDSVLPSGNSVTVRNLIRLTALTGDESYQSKARQTLELFAPLIDANPGGLTNMALALREYLDAEPLQSPGIQPPERQSPTKPPVEKDAEVQLIGGDKPVEAIISANNIFFSHKPLPPGGSAKVAIVIQIKDGWHIHANPTGDELIEPTTVAITSKLGIKLGKIQYPPPQEIELAGVDEPQRIWENQATVLAVLEIPAAAAGKKDELQIQIQYQPCTAKRCLPPAVLTLKVPVDIAKVDEPVKAINKKLFAPKATAAKP